MPLLPVSVPSLPSFPSFPSVSSMRAFLDSEPQLFYPAPKSPSRRVRRDSSSSTRSNASGVGGGIVGFGDGVASGSPIRRPAPGLGGLGRLDGASRSAVDLSGWGKVENPLAELGRRNSTSSKPFHVAVEGLATPPSRLSGTERCPVLTNTSPSPSPRKVHRRSHSALPTPGYTRPFSQIPPAAPRGRLTEFCRNPLASSSAVSLPTLAEGEMEHLHSPAGDDQTPMLHTKLYRRSSTRTNIAIPPRSPSSPTSSSSPVGSFPSPLSLSFSLDSSQSATSQDSDYFGPQPPIPEPAELDETPRPKRVPRDSGIALMLSPTTTSSSVPPPQRIARLRPPPSPRSYSDHPLPNQRARPRTQSYGPGLTIPLSRSVSTVSDVAVMATWSFPSSPEKSAGKDEGVSGEMKRGAGVQSDRLRDRLRTLSMLDTSSLLVPESTEPSPSDTVALSESPPEMHPSASGSTFQFPVLPPRHSPHLSHLQRGRTGHHRYTHSSPNSLTPPRSGQSQAAQHSHQSLLFPEMPTGSGAILARSASSGSEGRRTTNVSTRPGHRRTTTPSRLRSPQLLSLPLEQSGDQALPNLCAGNRRARSVQGRSSPTENVVSLPAQKGPSGHPLARTRSAVVPSVADEDGAKAGPGWWRMRSYSVSGAISPVPAEDGGLGVQVVLDDQALEARSQRGNSPEDERFIDFDDI